MIEGYPLDAAAARGMLEASGITFADWTVLSSPEAAAKSAGRLAGPLALKTAAGDVVHKSDAGCVILGVEGTKAASEAYRTICANAARAGSASSQDVLMESMVSGIAELIIGLKRDPTFGPVIMVGLGGVWVEVMRDVTLRLCPVTADEALTMLKDLRGFPLLDGARGMPRADLDALAGMIAAVSRLGKARPDILELDINPAVALTDGAVAIDGRVILEKPK